MMPQKKRVVVIVGLDSHHWQEGRPGPGCSQDFAAPPIRELEMVLVSTILKHCIALVAEEMPDDRLGEIGGTTVVSRVARARSLPHLNTDMTEVQRYAAGFVDPTPSDDSPEGVRLWGAREARWRDDLIAYDQWPTMFVCGARHAHRFADLLNRSAIEAQVEIERWKPTRPI